MRSRTQDLTDSNLPLIYVRTLGGLPRVMALKLSLLNLVEPSKMAKSLVIVESPAKAKTINKYLGSDFVVKSSVGHIRDLPTSGSGKEVDPKARAAAAAKRGKWRQTKK